MMSLISSFDFSALPKELPIFDLSDVVLLPRAHLPITVEGEKFKSLVDDVLKRDRLVGVVQKEPQDQARHKIFRSGCLGKMTTFTETEPGKYLVIVSGLVRFVILKELKRKNGYRRVKVSYEPFSFDLIEEKQVLFERETLVGLLKEYLTLYGISPNWDEINAASDERLITSLAMVCPFEPREKQALLESPSLVDRCRMMTAFIEMAFLRGSGEPWIQH